MQQLPAVAALRFDLPNCLFYTKLSTKHHLIFRPWMSPAHHIEKGDTWAPDIGLKVGLKFIECVKAICSDNRWKELASGIKNLIIYGLATDYCVKATAMDAVDAGFKVIVVEGLCKGVAPETTAQALEDMKAKGITIKAELDW